MKKIDWKNVGKQVGDFAVSVFGLALIGGFSLASRKSNVYVTKNYCSTTASYSKAVKAIMESDMYDHYKRTAITMLEHDGDADYYEAVISIVNSDMYDHYKVESIKSLSEE